jgi:phosphomannomutase
MPVTEVNQAELIRQARGWLDQDPDPETRAELTAVLARLPGSATDLADRFAGPLTFGTAGLRGPLRAGPNGMNLAVVRRAAAGLVDWLRRHEAHGPIVIGYDARYRSGAFAEETARVATGAGFRALVMPDRLPTPVLAFAVRALDAVAGVMVTASHNPPHDNGYKVYLGAALGCPGGAGAQLVPPMDAEIEAAIRAVGPLSTVPLGAPGERLGAEFVRSYVDAAVAVLDPGRVAGTDTTAGSRLADRAGLRIAYTPLHGVGGRVLTEVFTAAGFAAPAVVAAQAVPDPAFPTVSFPNPEEPGAMDLLLALAVETGAELAIANDPDADRCAVAIPEPGAAGGWRALRGDEVGVLLADHLIRRGVTGRFATTIVSSQLLAALCAARGQEFAQTLTGFKWIVRAGPDGAANLVFGYEEALGYCAAPTMVRDKDGITAALLVADLAAGLRGQSRTLADRLDDLAEEFGVYATDQYSVRVTDLAAIGTMMGRLRAAPPPRLLGEPVTSVEDLLPGADVIILRSAAARVVVRPSGTEPKLKAYLEVIEPVGGRADLPATRGRAAGRLAALRTEVATFLSG